MTDNQKTISQPTKGLIGESSKARSLIWNALEAAGIKIDGGSLFTDVVGGEVTFTTKEGRCFEVAIRELAMSEVTATCH